MSENTHDRQTDFITPELPHSLVNYGQQAALAGSICIGFSGGEAAGAAGLILASAARLGGGTVYMCDGLTPAETLYIGQSNSVNLAVYIGDSLKPEFYSVSAQQPVKASDNGVGRLLFIDGTEKKYTDSFKSYQKLKGVRLSDGGAGRGNRLFRIAAVKAGAFIHPKEVGIAVFDVSEDGMSLSVTDEAGITHNFKEIIRLLEERNVNVSDGIQAAFAVITASVDEKTTVASLFPEKHSGARAEKTLWVNGGADRTLAAFYRKYRGEAVPHKDGYLCDFGDEKIKIYPCRSGSQVKIAAESFNTETALELCTGMEMIIERLTQAE